MFSFKKSLLNIFIIIVVIVAQPENGSTSNRSPSYKKLSLDIKKDFDGDKISKKNQLYVELTKTDYFIENRSLVIYWCTANEINSFMFEVERKNIETNQWEKRGDVVAFGVSNTEKNYSYFEEEPIFGSSFYRLKIINIDGEYEYSRPVMVEYKPNTKGLEDGFVYEYNLYQNYPNPSNPITTIKYSIPEKSQLTISIYNTDSSLNKELKTGIANEGKHSFDWDTSKYTPGIYLIKMVAKTLDDKKLFTDTKKLVLVK